MYSKQEAAAIKRRFWTSFGQYMRPVRSASGETTNWLNYKTGIRNLYFRLDADRSTASIAVEIRHRDELTRNEYMEKFRSLKNIFESIAGSDWHWENNVVDEHGVLYSRIGKSQQGLDIFKEEDWPAIISFFKPAIMALDKFWFEAKDIFEF
jgi:hypothetical protein